MNLSNEQRITIRYIYTAGLGWHDAAVRLNFKSEKWRNKVREYYFEYARRVEANERYQETLRLQRRPCF